jgi:hypothetical protein
MASDALVGVHSASENGEENLTSMGLTTAFAPSPTVLLWRDRLGHRRLRGVLGDGAVMSRVILIVLALAGVLVGNPDGWLGHRGV